MRVGNLLKRLLRDSRGISAVEYGVILGVIVLVLVEALVIARVPTLRRWLGERPRQAPA